MPRIRILAAVLGVTLAACGSGGTTDGVASLDGAATTTTTPTEGADTMEEAMLAFTECLREQGLDVEDPSFDGQGGFGIAIGGPGGGEPGTRPDEDTRAAMDACAPLMEGVRGQFEAIDPSEMEDQLLAFADCMRREGVDWPDPDLTAVGTPGEGSESVPRTGGPFGGVDISDPAVQAAMQACQSELGFGFGTGRGPGGAAPGGEGS